jgi:NADH:ubiquinone oxidoreductase subunit 2 (subunit N)
MNTQSPNQQQNIELRLRTLRVIWLALFMSIGMYFVLTFFLRPAEDIEPNPMLSLILIGIGLAVTIIAFPVKNRFVTRAVEQQRVQLVQQGYIVAWALSEVPALLGLLDFVATRHPHYYILFLIAVLGQLIHFPRTDHLINATSKKPIS